MELTVEGPEEYANQSYSTLFERILVDVGLTTSIEGVHMVIRPQDPVFIISIRARRTSSLTPIKEIAVVEAKEGNAILGITDEHFAPRLLALLWRTYGRDRVMQLNRSEIIVTGVGEEVGELTLDPEEELRKRLLDIIWRLLPEGLKIRHEMVTGDILTVAATEHGMKKDFVAMAEDIHRKMEAS
jgi:putative methanogenesis marker protein 17